MSSKQATKREANTKQKKSETVPKKSKIPPAQNNNVDDVDRGKIHADDHQVPIVDETVKSRAKLPDEVLENLYNEPGRLLIAGNVAWDAGGTNKVLKRNELYVFHRFTDKKYRAIVSSASSQHSLLIDENWKVFSFGRNAAGQCGHEKLQAFNTPTLIEGLRHVNVIQAAAGAKHSLFLTDEGVVYACGENKYGKLGIGTKFTKRECIAKPMQINYNGPPIVQIGCGGDFSVILDIEGNLYTFGFPEYGQLGNNTDGKFFNDHNKLVFDMVHSPKLVSAFIEKNKDGRVIPVTNVKIVNFACGKNHTVAIDAEKRAFSFGFGGYGRLGHNEQKDEWMPRLIKYLNERVTGGALRAVCGTKYSLVISGHNNPYLFGRNKDTSAGNGQMYPKVVDQLCGFKLKSIGCSCTSIVIACDGGKLIAWGSSPCYGELGIGNDPKSSSQPTFVEYMDDVQVSQVTMGLEHTLLLVNTDDTISNQKYQSQPEYVPIDEKTKK